MSSVNAGKEDNRSQGGLPDGIRKQLHLLTGSTVYVDPDGDLTLLVGHGDDMATFCVSQVPFGVQCFVRITVCTFWSLFKVMLSLSKSPSHSYEYSGHSAITNPNMLKASKNQTLKSTK